MSSDTTIEVWYDGDCPVCVRSRAWAENRDRADRLDFRDFRSARDEELPAERERHRSTMMVRTPSDRLLAGFEAWRRIMLELPGWRWLGRLAGLAPLVWFGPAVYGLVARHRHRVPMPMPSCDDS